MHRHLAFLILLRDRLRDQITGEESKYLSEHDKKELQNKLHPANVILTLQAKDLQFAEKLKYIDIPILLQLNMSSKSIFKSLTIPSVV